MPNISSSVILKGYLLQCIKCHGLHKKSQNITFLCRKFSNDLTWCSFSNLCHFKATTLYSHEFMVQEFIITNFAEKKKSDLSSGAFNSSLFMLTVWEKIGSIQWSSHNSFNYSRMWCSILSKISSVFYIVWFEIIYLDSKEIKQFSITKKIKLTQGFIKPTALVTFIIDISNLFWAIQYHPCYMYYFQWCAHDDD